MAPYLNVRSAGFRGWLPSGEGILIATRFADTVQIHHVRQPGGARHQLTFEKEPVRSIRLRRGNFPASFLYLRDSGGDENYQIHLRSIGNAEDRPLTSGPGRQGLGIWDREGRQIAYAGTARNGRDYDIYLMQPDSSSTAQRVYEGTGFWSPVAFSPDNQQLLLIHYISANESELHLLNLPDGSIRRIDARPEPVSISSATWSPNGKHLFYSHDADSEFARLERYDLSSGTRQMVTSAIPWDVEEFELDDSGRRAAFVVNADGLSELYLLDPETLVYERVTNAPEGLLSSLQFDPQGQRLGLTVSSGARPSDVFSYDLVTGQWTRWTHSEVGGLDTKGFQSPELIRFPTFDKVNGRPRLIPAFYYRPAGEGPFPVIISIHGGPESQSRPGFSSDTQFLLNELQVAVIYPNVRGSSGYGKSFLKLDNGRLREDSVRDISALIDWIGTSPDLDSSRIGVRGGSYGGYMVFASMVHESPRLAGGISVVGISHFVTFLENTKSYRRDLRRVEYGDERDPEMRAFLEEISPLRQAQRIRKPLYIAQGFNDPRVPASEARQILEAIRGNGQEAWFFLAMDEGHGFSKKPNADFHRLASMSFWVKIFGLSLHGN